MVVGSERTRVLVTGGSGFIGRNLVASLAADPRFQVRVLAREPGRLAAPAGMEVVAGALEDAGSLRWAADGRDVVIHLAAQTGKASSRAHFATNVEGTRRLAEAARSASIRRFVFVSSVAAGLPDLRYYPYGRSKAEAEALLLASGLDVVIVRPTIVLGPGSPFHAGLRRMALGRRIQVFGSGDVAVQPVHVDDVVEGLVALVLDDPGPREPIGMGGPEVLAWTQLLMRVRTALGRPPARLRRIPVGPAMAVLGILEPILRPLLPITRAQLVPFTQASTVPSHPFWKAHAARLRPLSVMLEDLRHDRP
jgi:nucleoside-diphosphate-sugar epimerase